MTNPPYGHDPNQVPQYPNPYPYQQPASPYQLPAGSSESPSPYGYPVSGVPQPYGYPVSGVPQPYSPYPAGYLVPAPVSYGVDPITGVPLSDKSKIVAGLLQLLLGLLLGLGGVGRVYAGNVGLGVTQIALSVVGWVSFWCGILFILPLFVFFGLWLWFVIDGIVLLAGRPVDGQGRLLRS